MKLILSLILSLALNQLLVAAECTCQCTCGAAEITESDVEIATGELVRIKAKGGSSFVLIKANTKELFKGTIKEGKEIEVKHLGKLSVMMTAAENIVIEYNGEEVKPDSSGAAKITLETEVLTLKSE